MKYINLFNRLSALREQCKDNPLWILAALEYCKLVERKDNGTLGQFASWIEATIKNESYVKAKNNLTKEI